MNETFYVQGLKTTSIKFVLPIPNALFVSKSHVETNSISTKVKKCTHINLSNARTPQGYLESLQVQATQHGIGMPKDLDGRKENVYSTNKRPFWTFSVRTRSVIIRVMPNKILFHMVSGSIIVLYLEGAVLLSQD